MADLIKIKCGSGDTPQLQVKEIAYNITEKALYIGTNEGNKKLCNADDIQRLANLILTVEKLSTELGNKLTATKATAQAPLTNEATLAEIVTSFNDLISVLKTSGIMESEV